MNAQRRSERSHHDPRLERSLLALLALAAISAAWLAIGLPGLPPLMGGVDAGNGQHALVANLHGIARHSDAGAMQPHPHSREQVVRRNASLLPRTPPPPTPRKAVETQPPRSDDFAAPPPASASASAPPPPVPAPPAPTRQTADPASKLLDDVQNVAASIGSLASGSAVANTEQNATSTATNLAQQAPTVIVPPEPLPQVGR